MALKLGELVAFLKTDNKQLRAGLKEGEEEVKRSGERMGRSSALAALQNAANWARSFAFMSSSSRQAFRSIHADMDVTRARLRDLTREYGRTHDEGTLREINRLKAHLGQLTSAASELGRGGFRAAVGAMGTFVSMAGNAVTSIVGLVAVLFLLFAVLSLVVPLTYVLGGALGALPAIATGGLAAVAALAFGFWGLADAFQETSNAGGSVVDRARQIMLAQRRLTDAQREATAAQDALTRAHASAAERMQDLNRNLAGARLDEESAVQALADARRQLERAQLSEDPVAIARAKLAYRQAEQSLADVQDRVEDLAAEQAEAARKGVQGSDEVQAALERQRRAVEGVSDAQYELQRAQTQSSGGAAKQATEIAASAQAAVDMIKSLMGQYKELRLMVQERLFAGVDAEIKSLSDAWMPTLRERLGSMADMFNGLFKQWAETSRKPEFIANISAGWKNVEDMLNRILGAVAGPGLEAFGTLSRAAKPFLDAMGDRIAQIIEDFAAWIDMADKDGSLDQFFKDAGQFFRDVIDIGEDALSIFGSIISIIMGSSKKAGAESPIEHFKQTMDDLAKWFDDPKNQEKIEEFFGKIGEFFIWVKDEAIPTIKDWITNIDRWSKRIDGWIEGAKRFGGGVKGAFDTAKNAVTGLPGAVATAARNLWNPLWSGFKSTLNLIIDAWNNLRFTIGGGSFAGISFPSATFDTPNIPRLAQGAYVPATPGGRLAVMAEAGQDEWALPDNKLQAALDEAVARGRFGGDGASAPEVHVYIGERELTDMVRVEVRDTSRGLKRRATAGSGTR